MGFTLTALDTAYEAPDDETIARVVASMDGRRIGLITLGPSDAEYVEVRGTVQDGFALSHQAGGLDRRRRSTDEALPLPLVLEVLGRYARHDPDWARGVAWEADRHVPPAGTWSGTWVSFTVLVVLTTLLVWLWRGW